MSGTGACSGYHWSQGQYVLSSCTQESSTFFIVLGFTMLVLVLLVFFVVIIACFRRKRLRRSQQSTPLASLGLEDDCIINVDGMGLTGRSANGRDLDNVKCVIMAGDDKPTFIAHPVPPSSYPPQQEQQEQELDVEVELNIEEHMSAAESSKQQQLDPGESSKRHEDT